MAGPMTMPLPSSSCRAALIMRAAVSGSSARAGEVHPDRRVKNAGNSSVLYAHTHTPCAWSGAADQHLVD